MACAYVFYSFGNEIYLSTACLPISSFHFPRYLIWAAYVKETISSLVQGFVVPNIGLRSTIATCIVHNAPFSPEHEMEQFEDNPLCLRLVGWQRISQSLGITYQGVIRVLDEAMMN